MGNVASYDTGDKVSWGHGNTLKQSLPAGVHSQICYEGSKRQKLSPPNAAVAKLLATKGLSELNEQMRQEVNAVGGVSVPSVVKKIQAVVRAYKPKFAEHGVELYHVKKFNGQNVFLWFEYVDVSECKESNYVPTAGLSGTSSEYV